jgi:hypothetical protein
VTSYFEWLAAGSFEVRSVAGAMQRSDRAQPLVRHVRFGFDAERLFVCVEGQGPMRSLLGDGREVSLTFLAPADLRFVVRQTAGALAGLFATRHPTAGHWVEDGARGASVAAGSILEIALPLAALGVAPGALITFFVAVGQGETEFERHPSDRPIQVNLPDAAFGARLWSA